MKAKRLGTNTQTVAITVARVSTTRKTVKTGSWQYDPISRPTPFHDTGRREARVLHPAGAVDANATGQGVAGQRGGEVKENLICLAQQAVYWLVAGLLMAAMWLDDVLEGK